jgi:hypothetical protein
MPRDTSQVSVSKDDHHPHEPHYGYGGIKLSENLSEGQL